MAGLEKWGKGPLRGLFRGLLLGLALLGTGCGKMVLYSNVGERQANEMIALLRTRNMAVEKVVGLEGTWSIMVANTDFAAAVDVLGNYGYPQDQFATLGQVFQKSGLVSSPTEERARFMYALSENLAEMISHIAGVVTARVNIVLPDNNPYTDSISPSSAAVFVAYRPGTNIEDAVRDIKYLVTNSIEGLAYDKVSVALFPAPMASEEIVRGNELVNMLSIHMTRSSVLVFWLVLLVVVAATACLSFVGAKLILDYLSVKKEEKQKARAKAAPAEEGEPEGAAGDGDEGN
ncbi:MAG: type III secretion inner membrane ring lipoprotein SctJ [Puniceicoccales bacterium]|jgi:type III secretion protein J|nr:type III secretion inner membrane ring lipoprotein SctJ [Puniceicoccales bacterium]